MPGRVELGRVMGAHGLRGEIRVRYFGDGPDNLLRLTQLSLAREADDASARSFDVAGVRPGRPNEVLLALIGVGDREKAAALRGLRVWVEADQLEALPPGEHYWHELVGCRVETADGRSIGTVREVWETGAHDVIVVESEDGRRHLLPTARELMPEIDPAAGRIVVELLPGMLGPSEGGGATESD